MSTALPVELVLLILSHLDRNSDRQTLKSLALTSSSFRDPCQSFLFSHLAFTSPSAGTRCASVLSASPWLAAHVKRLTISDECTQWGNWLATDMKLVEALKRLDLTQVVGFTFSRGPGANWETLSSPVRKAIVKICRSPALTDLDLLWAPLPLATVCGSSLKNLRVFQCTVGPTNDIAQTGPSSVIFLDSLELWSDWDGVAMFFLDPFNNIRLDALQALEVHTYSAKYHRFLQGLMSSSRMSLQTLVFRPSAKISSRTEAMLSVAGYPELTWLELEVDATTPDSRGSPLGLPWTAYFICSIPPSNAIETIRLKLVFDLPNLQGGLRGPRGAVVATALGEIGRFINKPGALPCLQAVLVDVELISGTNLTTSLRTWVLGALDIPEGSGLLRVEAFHCPQDSQ